MIPSKQKNQKRVVIIIGPPGSGKGTQAILLAEKLNLYYLETSKILEANVMKGREGESIIIEGKQYPFSEEKKKWLTGFLMTPAVVSFWMKNKIQELASEGKNLLLAGSPRTLEEAEKLTPVLAKFYGKENLKVVLLEISAQETIFRNSHRKICELMRHPVLSSKETAKLTICPLDGSKLMARKGLDDPKTIKVRLERYREETLPVIEFLKKAGLAIKKVNGSPAPAVVFKNILKSL